MKKYIEPEMNIDLFDAENVTAASNLNNLMEDETNGNFKTVTAANFFDGVTFVP